MEINILVILLILIAIWRIVEGYRAGMVKSLISLVTLFFLGIGIAILSRAVSSYLHKEIFNFIVAAMLFLILCLAHSSLRFIFFSAKLVAKLPVVRLINRLLGVLMGLIETVCFTWIIFFFAMTFDMGVIRDEILLYTKDNAILTFLYERNYIAFEAEKLLPKVMGLFH